MSSCAIRVVNAAKWYYAGEPVLKGLSMSVEQGSIYGLLGQSGGGKTTLLRCIMGLRNLNSGYISLFGHVPADYNLSKMIGYMPQDTALYELMKISEIFEYYGVLAGLSHQETRQRSAQLVNLLRLPNSSQLINSLSGGQKRRASLGVALISGENLKLLILDEPTVGNDALIKQEIWNYLRELVAGGMTILLTTHCTSEAGLCDKIGLLRRGRLIAEGNPLDLLNNCGASLLDEAIVYFCKESQKEEDNENDGLLNLITTPSKENSELNNVVPMLYNKTRINSQDDTIFEFKNKVKNQNEDWNFKQKKKSCLQNGIEWCRKLFVISKRNIIYQQVRQPILTFITYFFPFIQVLLLTLIVSQDPKGQKLNLINMEANCSNNSELLSCKLLRHLELATDTIWVDTNSTDLATVDINLGDTVGYIQFPANFTENLLLRVALNRFAQDNELEGTNVKIELDTTDPVLFVFLFTNIIKSLQYLYEEVAKKLGVDKMEVQLPLKFNSVYKSGGHWSHYAVPPIGPMLTFILNLGWAAINHSLDLSTGSAERSKVGGATGPQLFLSYYVAGTFTMLIQTTIIYTTCLAYFGFQELEGELWIIYLLTVLAGYVGTSIGLLLATHLQNTLQSAISSMFIGISVVYTCSLTFTIETIPYAYRIVLYLINPITGLYSACRAVWSKGFGISHPVIVQRMSLSVLWLLVTSVLSSTRSKMHKFFLSFNLFCSCSCLRMKLQ